MATGARRKKRGGRRRREREQEPIDVEGVIEKLVSGGDGLLRHGELPVFVPFSVPGDRVRVRLTRRKAAFARGEIVEILEPSPDRREPPCAHFGTCGGCDLQHIEDARQAELKRDAALETLQRLGRLELPADTTLLTGATWRYRLRAQFHWSSRPSPRAGFLAEQTHTVVPVEECAVLEQPLEDKLHAINRTPPKRLYALSCVVGEDGAISEDPVRGRDPDPITIRVGPDALTFDARCFFQPHRDLLEPFTRLAVGEETGKDAFDLYCGVGLLTLALSHRYETVTGVESDLVSADYALENALANGRKNVGIVNRPAEDWMRALPENAPRVVVDPPRNGLSAPVREALMERPPRHLTYVSCDAATLARDLRELGKVFAVSELGFVDLFPQTKHLETVVQLRPA